MEVAQLPCLEVFLGIWFRGDYSGSTLLVALSDVEGLFQPWYSVIL